MNKKRNQKMSGKYLKIKRVKRITIWADEDQWDLLGELVPNRSEVIRGVLNSLVIRLQKAKK